MVSGRAGLELFILTLFYLYCVYGIKSSHFKMAHADLGQVYAALAVQAASAVISVVDTCPR